VSAIDCEMNTHSSSSFEDSFGDSVASLAQSIAANMTVGPECCQVCRESLATVEEIVQIQERVRWAGRMSICARCSDMARRGAQMWHPECFVCVQCLQPFPKDVYFEFEGRCYCEHDYIVLCGPKVRRWAMCV
jgi:hypothetical protein